MSTLVQHNNSPHYPQSTNMNSGEGSSARPQRPKNVSSKNLLPNELACLYDILGTQHVTLATAVAQVLHGNNGAWRKQACGVFCFVKDYDNRSYCFRLYDLKTRQSIYEENVPALLHLEKALDVFYTFDGSNCKIGINFVDRDEAQAFSHYFHSKQDDRRNKKKPSSSTKAAPTPAMPSTVPSSSSSVWNNVAKPVANITPQAPVASLAATTTPKNTSTVKNPGFFTLGRNKKKTTRLDISAPIADTLVHVGHIGTKDSFFNDDSQKRLFEQVIASMGISAEDESYVRAMVEEDGGFGKLLTSSKPSAGAQNYQGTPNTAPTIPQRAYESSGRNNGGPASHQNTPAGNSRVAPLQGLFNPPAGHNQPPVPIIPPRPGPRPTDNAYSSAQAPPAPPPPPPPPQPPSHSTHNNSRPQAPFAPPPPPPPPPPFPTSGDFTYPSHPSGGPPPPPPPPPPPGPVSHSAAMNSSPSARAPDLARGSLLNEICAFDTSRGLKSAKKRPELPQVSPSGETSPGAQDTMAMNIMKILEERRRKIKGEDDDDNDNDPSEDEWST